MTTGDDDRRRGDEDADAERSFPWQLSPHPDADLDPDATQAMPALDPDLDPDATQAVPAVDPDAPPPADQEGEAPLTRNPVTGGIGAVDLLPPAPPAVEPEPSELDELFADVRFRDYDAETMRLPAADPVPSGDGAEAETGRLSRIQRTGLIVMAAAAAVLALGALFLLGTRLPAMTVHDDPAVVEPDPTTSAPAEPTAEPGVPLEPGTYDWDELRGGECLDPYTSPWAEEFTVVPCDEPHAAQLTYRGELRGGAMDTADYPGAEALQSQIPLLCGSPAVLDLDAAGDYTDIQVAGSYPATAEQWDADARAYYCFVSRSSGEPLEVDLAAPEPEAADGL